MDRPALPLAAFVVLLLPPVAGFASLPPGSSPHDDVTQQAAEAAGWPGDAMGALREAVRKPDLDEIEWDPRDDKPTHIRPTEDYRSEHHCDRVPPEDNATAFLATAAYVQQQRGLFRDSSDPTQRVQALGRALHAVQDCYSHSNHVDLEPEAQRAFDGVLLNGSGQPPAGLVLVAVAPDADRPGMPEDPYPHDAHAKDREGMNNESEARVGNGTKFDAASRAAVAATRAVLEDELGRLSQEERTALGRARVEAPDQNPLPAPGVALSLAVLAASASALARRR